MSTTNQIITSNTTWSANQPVDLTSKRIQVSPGVTLTIEEGAQVIGGSIDVWGDLFVSGTSANPVEFSNTDIAYFGSSGDPAYLEINYAQIDGGSVQRATGNAVYGTLKLTNSTLENTGYMYIWYPTSKVEIKGNSFLAAGGISVGHRGPDVEISNNLFVDQTTSFAVRNWASYSGTTLVTNNSFLSQDRIAMELPAGYDSAAISAADNYFGSTSLSTISQMIFDRNDDLSSAGLISTSFTSTPSPDTPQFTNTSIVVESPNSTVNEDGKVGFSVSTSSLDVLVSLLGNVFLLKGLKETITSTTHTVEYAGTTFNWSEVDSFVTTVVRDGEFTEEFAQEIADAYPDAAGISYNVAVALLGSAFDETVIAVAGADGNYVG